MATSNKYNFGKITADDIITEAFERCGIINDDNAGLQFESGRRSLNFILSQWINSDFPALFLIKKALIPLVPGQISYTLPSNCVDILEMSAIKSTRQLGGIADASPEGGNPENAFTNNLSEIFQQTAPNGWISYTFNTPQQIPYIGIMSAADNYYEFDLNVLVSTAGEIASPENIYLKIPRTFYPANQTLWWVVPSPPIAKIWRLTEIGGATLGLNKIYFNNNSPNLTSRYMTRLSRSNYAAITNKNIVSTVAQFQLDRNPSQQVINIYPAPNNEYDLLLYNYQSYPEDVDSFIQQVDAPQRFFEALTAELAARLAVKFNTELVGVLQPLAQSAFQAAKVEDVERVPIKIMPNSNAYS